MPSFDGSSVVFPWIEANTYPYPFGRSPAIPLPDHTMAVLLMVDHYSEDVDHVQTWKFKFIHCSATGVVLSSIEEPSLIDINGCGMVATGPYTARAFRTDYSGSPWHYEVVDVDFETSPPTVTAHTPVQAYPAGEGPSFASYSHGIGSYYFPADDLTVITEHSIETFVGDTHVHGYYIPSASSYDAWVWWPSDTDQRRFLMMGAVWDYGIDMVTMTIYSWSISSAGIATSTLLGTINAPMEDGDLYPITPVDWSGGVFTVLERLNFDSADPVYPNSERGWAVRSYNAAGVRTEIARVPEDVVYPSYLADNPDVQADATTVMVFADKGPDWGAFEDWGSPPHQGFEREVLVYDKPTQRFSGMVCPSPDLVHGELDSLTARSTAGSFRYGRWAMGFTGTDLYDGTGEFYGSNLFWGSLGLLRVRDEADWRVIGYEGDTDPGRLRLRTGTQWIEEIRQGETTPDQPVVPLWTGTPNGAPVYGTSGSGYPQNVGIVPESDVAAWLTKTGTAPYIDVADAASNYVHFSQDTDTFGNTIWVQTFFAPWTPTQPIHSAHLEIQYQAFSPGQHLWWGISGNEFYYTNNETGSEVGQPIGFDWRTFTVSLLSDTDPLRSLSNFLLDLSTGSMIAGVHISSQFDISAIRLVVTYERPVVRPLKMWDGGGWINVARMRPMP